MKIFILLLALMSSLSLAEESAVKMIERESDFCAGKKLNPPHCQEDGNCYHFVKKPIYPLNALKNEIEGYAIIKFDTNSSGCTLNHIVVESSPIEDFGVAAIKAAKNYRYSGAQKDVEEKITFSLEK